MSKKKSAKIKPRSARHKPKPKCTQSKSTRLEYECINALQRLTDQGPNIFYSGSEVAEILRPFVELLESVDHPPAKNRNRK